MDFLGSFRDAGPEGGWAPTAEKVMSADQLSEPAAAAGAADMAGGLPGAAAWAGPGNVVGGAGGPIGDVRPAGFGPPRRLLGTADPGTLPALTPEDLEALEQLAPEEPDRGGGRGAGAGRLGRQLGEPPVSPTGQPASLGSPVAPAPSPVPAVDVPVGRRQSMVPVADAPAGGVQSAVPVADAPAGTVESPMGRMQPAMSRVRSPVRPSPVSSGPAPGGLSASRLSPAAVRPATNPAGAGLVQPIPTWPPQGERAEWSPSSRPGKKIGPVPSKHRPDPRRKARRRAVLGLLVLVVAGLAAWSLVTKPWHHAHPARLIPAATAVAPDRLAPAAVAFGGPAGPGSAP